MSEQFKTRFCPSPTGFMHLGNARTALFNVLLSQSKAGIFLLRIEDTDKSRSEEEYTVALQQDLHWLGADWQEGPEVDGGNGPYWQSQRHAIYDKYYKQLEDNGDAYPCFCSEEQLALSRKIQRSQGKAPRYPGTCRSLSAEEVAQKREQGMQPTLRFKLAQSGQIKFHDLVKGSQRFNLSDIGDFIIRRADGTASFMFCNAIDDALMGITHLLRGEDHLTNTPRQIAILECLKLPIPNYGHMPLIVGADGSPLSKRHGSKSIADLRGQGYLPLTIVNYLARLGHYYPENKVMTFAELAEQFNIENIGRSAARFDADHLNYWQKEVIMQLSNADFWDWIKLHLHGLVASEHQENFVTAIRGNIVFPGEAQHWETIIFSDNWQMGAEAKELLTDVNPEYFTTAITLVENNVQGFQSLMSHLKETLNVKGKALFMPMRVALTGEAHGPEMALIYEVLGKAKIIKRLQAAKSV